MVSSASRGACRLFCRGSAGAVVARCKQRSAAPERTQHTRKHGKQGTRTGRGKRAEEGTDEDSWRVFTSKARHSCCGRRTSRRQGARGNERRRDEATETQTQKAASWREERSFKVKVRVSTFADG